MRLLKREETGWFGISGPSFSLTEFIGDNIPQYAVLSHTWGADSEEVTLADVKNRTGKNKAGYRKLKFCAEQAAVDGLTYFWVDTCCIDKTNNTELGEALNSMFKWYRSSSKCYVFLSDVSISEPDENGQLSRDSWLPAFKSARWFTRGWALQELIAPKSVEFFSKEGMRLESKESLEQEISSITGIAIDALRGKPLSEFSVDDRMSWSAKRNTTREEDAAYCLLGIFDVYMPLIYGEGRSNALGRLQKEIQELKTPTAPSSHTVSWSVPFGRNRHFTGRENQLAQLKQKLFIKGYTTKIAITGLGGVGKTQLVLELIYQIKDELKKCSTFWIPATNIKSLQQAYIDVAQQLCIPGWESNESNVVKLVQQYLSTENAGQWLLVFDNADDINLWTTHDPVYGRLLDCLPQSTQGCIIFTTRDRKTAVGLARQNVVNIQEMNEGIATQLLQNYLINKDLFKNSEDTKVLLEKLIYLPLAIVQAATYINQNGITFRDYTSLLAEQEQDVIDLLSEEFQDDERYYDIKNPVATTWLISFDQIRSRDPLAADYLSFMACVDPRDIPQSLLPAGESRKKEIEAIGTLDAYSFITKRVADQAIDLHRLVHLATRNWLRKEGLTTQCTERVIKRLNEVFPNDEDDNRTIWRTYLPHARYTLRSDCIKDVAERIDLAFRFGKCLKADGQMNEAELQLVEVTDWCKKTYGLEHPDTLESMTVLASIYWDQGRWKQAEHLDIEVTELSRKALGAEHENTLRSMNDLATIYMSQGRWNEAEVLAIQVFETRKRVLGKDHPYTLTSMGNLASTYFGQSRWKEAEDLELELIETRKRLFGLEHPETLRSMHNLASTYWNLKRWEEAETMEIQVWETRKIVLGPEHPDTLLTMSDLATTYHSEGRYEEAERLYSANLEMCARVLGEEHPQTIQAKKNFAVHCLETRKDEGLETMIKILEMQVKVLGTEHPETQLTKDLIESLRPSFKEPSSVL